MARRLRRQTMLWRRRARACSARTCGERWSWHRTTAKRGTCWGGGALTWQKMVRVCLGAAPLCFGAVVERAFPPPELRGARSTPDTAACTYTTVCERVRVMVCVTPPAGGYALRARGGVRGRGRVDRERLLARARAAAVRGRGGRGRGGARGRLRRRGHYGRGRRRAGGCARAPDRARRSSGSRRSSMTWHT
jgi:hypothetical protein